MGNESAERPPKKHKSAFDEDACTKELERLETLWKNNDYVVFEREMNVPLLIDYLHRSESCKTVDDALKVLNYAAVLSSSKLDENVPALINVLKLRPKHDFMVLSILDEVFSKDNVLVAMDEFQTLVELLDTVSSYNRDQFLEVLMKVIDKQPENSRLLANLFACGDANTPLNRLLKHQSLTPKEKERVMAAVAASWRKHVSCSASQPVVAKQAAGFRPVHAKVLQDASAIVEDFTNNHLPAVVEALMEYSQADLEMEDPNIIKLVDATSHNIAISLFNIRSRVSDAVRSRLEQEGIYNDECSSEEPASSP